MPTVSERTGFSVQQVSWERGHALFLLIQPLFSLSHALGFMAGLVVLLIKKNKCVSTKGLGIDKVCKKKRQMVFPTFQTNLFP